MRLLRQTAAEGIVLLKNNGALPFRTKRCVALFGENSYDFLSGGTGSGCVHPPYVVDILEGLKNAGITSTETMTDIYRKYIDYAKVKFQAERHPAKWFQQAYFGQQKYPEIGLSPIAINKEAQQVDAAIITIGRQAGEGIDRDIATEFNLMPEEHALITDVCNAFHAVGKPVVVIINSGSVSGKEVAQVYVQAPKGRLQKPVHELKAFAKTRELKPGESQTLTMTIPIRDLASFDEAGSQWLTEAGTYTFRIGAASRDIKATAQLKLAEYTEKTTNALAPKQELNLLKQ